MLKWITIAIVIIAGSIFLFRESLKVVAVEKLTEDMFVGADADSYNPGLPVGTRFPAIRARHEGQVIRSVERFIGDRGMVFIAVRSADW